MIIHQGTTPPHWKQNIIPNLPTYPLGMKKEPPSTINATMSNVECSQTLIWDKVPIIFQNLEYITPTWDWVDTQSWGRKTNFECMMCSGENGVTVHQGN